MAYSHILVVPAAYTGILLRSHKLTGSGVRPHSSHNLLNIATGTDIPFEYLPLLQHSVHRNTFPKRH